MRVLAIRAGALGDTILALPAIAGLRRTAARVEVAGTVPYVELALGPGLAAATHSLDRAMFRALFQDGASEAELLEFLGRFEDLRGGAPRISRAIRSSRGVVAAAPFGGEIGRDRCRAHPVGTTASRRSSRQ